MEKKSKKGKILFLLILILVICAVLAGAYFFVFTKPQFVFKTALGKILKAKDTRYTSVKIDSATNISGELENDEYNAVMEEIAKCVLKFGTQVDLTSKEEMVDVGLTYDNKEVISLKEYYDGNKIYLYFNDILDKCIDLEIPDDVRDELNEILDNNMYGTDKQALKIFSKELNNNLQKNAKYSKENVTMTIDNSNEELVKSTLKITESGLYKTLSGTYKNLSENDEFLQSYNEQKEQELVKTADEFANKALSANDEDTIVVSIFTKGFLYKFKGFEITSNEEDVDITVFKLSNNEYEFKIKSNDEQMIEGIFTKSNDGFIIETKLKEVGTIKIKTNYTISYNTEMEKLDTSNSVTISGLTEDDYINALESLSERPLIGEYINSYMKSLNTANTNDYEKDLTTEKNELNDYGYDVKYDIPSDFKYIEDYASDTYKTYKKELDDYDYISAKTMMRYRSSDEYYDEIKSSNNYFKENDNYKNVTLSEVKEVEVEGNKFKYAISEYEADYGYSSDTYKYKYIYAWYTLDENVIYTVELNSYNQEINLDMIKDFLNITTKKSN